MFVAKLTFEHAYVSFPAECDALLGADWMNEAKAVLGSCAEASRWTLGAQLLPFLLAAGLRWWAAHEAQVIVGLYEDPLRLVLERVRADLERTPVEPTAGMRDRGDFRRGAPPESHRQHSHRWSEEQGSLPSLSEESLQGLNSDELRQKCIELSDRLNLQGLELTEAKAQATMARKGFEKTSAELKGVLEAAPFTVKRERELCADRSAISNRLTQEMSHTIKAVKDFQRLSASYVQMSFRLDEVETQRDEVLDALGALAQPDGTICGPLLDGPELDALNAALYRNSESAADDSFREGGTVHVPPGADVYIYLCDEGKEPAPYERDELIVAAERLLNVTGARGLELENKIRGAVTSDEMHEHSARHALHDAIMRTKTIGPDGPYDPQKAKQEVRDAAEQLLLCTTERGFSLRVKVDRNSHLPAEISEFNARQALIKAIHEER